ncbi:MULTISPECIES: hypothetical protein [Sinorhizobium]|uniref:ATP-dependent DNA ligase n=1 Tax=Sinorhizobium TaxID=28105 RepID=UPI0018656CD9|nr:hypothetical protein [Sinorhizobium meliloti]MDW9364345.1 hypothetical protein [Sinorhizobium meliloti]
MSRDIAPTDPMPARIDPCLATLVDKPAKGPDSVYEVKWNGYELAVHIEPGRVRILTRGGYDWTERFPTIADDARRLAVKTAIIDGEAVVLGKWPVGLRYAAAGAGALAVGGGGWSHRLLCFYAFDLIYLDGRDPRRLPLRAQHTG